MEGIQNIKINLSSINYQILNHLQQITVVLFDNI